jgi:GNAT superfamily N-acetyltransferase
MASFDPQAYLAKAGKGEPTKSGFDPRAYLSKAKDKTNEDSSTVGAFFSHVAEAVLPGAAALGGREAGGELGTALGGPIGGVVGAVGGGILAGGVADVAERAIAPKFINDYLDKASKEHPVASFAGDIAGQLPTMGVGGTAKQAVLGAGLGGSLETAREVVGDEDLSPAKIGMATAAGAVMNKPTSIGRKIQGMIPHKTPVDILHAKQEARGKIPDTLPDHEQTTVQAEKHLDFLNNPPASYHPKDAIDIKNWAIKKLEDPSLQMKEDSPVELEDARATLRVLKDRASNIIKGDQHPSIRGEHGITISRSGGYIDQVLLPEDLQKQGLGTKIVENLEHDIKEEGHTVAFIHAKPKSEGFWEKRGYIRDQNFVDEEGENIPMSKRLDNKPKSTTKENTPRDILHAKQEASEAPKHDEMLHPDLEADPRGMNFKPPTTDQERSDMFYSLDKNKEADLSEHIKTILEPMQKEGVDLEMEKAWRLNEEEGKPLTEEQARLKAKYHDKLEAERKANDDQITKDGKVESKENTEEATGKNVASKRIFKNKMSWWEKVKEKLSSGDQGGLDLNIEKKPEAAMKRSMFVAEFPNGKRVVIQAKANEKMAAKGTHTKVVQWNKGRESPFATVPEWVKPGDKIGEATVVEGTQTEKETHSPYRYNKSYMSVLAERVRQQRDFIRSYRALEALKQDPKWETIAHKIEPGVDVPPGMRTLKYTDKLPELAGYAFENRTAETLEDIARKHNPNALTMMSSVLIKNMMINPLPHMLNEAWHVYNARGLTGWSPVGKHGYNKSGVDRFLKTSLPAMKSVATQDKDFQRLLRKGASFLSANVRNQPIEEALLDRGAQEFITTPEGKELASKWGMKPLDLYNAISKKMSSVMWVARDGMYMQLIQENVKYKGMTEEQAIKAVERHMPAYKIPPRVMGNRKLSEALQNPSLTVFSRYHYGMMKSLTNTVGDIAGKRGMEGFKEGVDSMAAIAVAMSVLYPLQDMIAQAITGNEDSSVRRAGPYHLLHALSDIQEGKKQPYSALASFFTFNPVLLDLAQIAADRQLYNGQQIYNTGDTAENITKDIGGYAAKQVPMISTSLQSEGGSGLWKQVDVIDPSRKQLISEKKTQTKMRVQARNREKREAKQRLHEQ